MNDFLLLCISFFKAGLFSVGGGLATLPFLTQMAKDYPHWFSLSELANMIAVSESTPGPIGINASTYAGYKVFGIPGSIAATFSLVLPSFIVVMIISKFWEKYRKAEKVEKVFAALRAAAIGLILSAGVGVFVSAVFPGFSEAMAAANLGISEISGIFSLLGSTVNIKAVILFVIMMIASQNKKLKKLHPIFFIIVAAVVGIIFKF